MSANGLLRVLIIVALLVVDLDGTAIVVLKTRARIIFAADSFESGGGLTCKIVKAGQSGQWWLLAGGFMNAKNPDLDLRAEISRAIATATTMADVEHAMSENVFPQIKHIFELPSAEESIRRWWDTGDQVGAYVVAGSDNGVLTVGILIVTVDSVAPVRVTGSWLSCPGSWCEVADEPIYYSASVDGPAVDRVVERPLAPWVARGDSAAAKRLIEMQIAETPELVRAPIDILEVTTSGAKWIGRDPASLCHAPTR